MPVNTSEAVKLFIKKHGGDSDTKAPGNIMNEIKDRIIYVPHAGDEDPAAATASKAQTQANKLPGAFWDHGGTTQYNPLRTDPRVEAIIGEKKYTTTVSKDSPEETRLTVKQLQQQVETLTKLLGAEVKNPVEKTVITEVALPDYENMAYYDLLEEAKSMYPELRGRPKKEDLLQMIKNKAK